MMVCTQTVTYYLGCTRTFIFEVPRNGDPLLHLGLLESPLRPLLRNLLGLPPELQTVFSDLRRREVRRHHEHRVLALYRLSLSVSEASFVKELYQK